LTREYGVDLIVTTPSVGYLYEGEVVTNPMQVPVKAVVAEPWARVILIAPENYSSALIAFCLTRRGIMLDSHPMGSQVQLAFELPLAELVVNFYDQLKSMTSGYASMDYELIDFREVEVVRLDILVAGEPVDALSHIVIEDKSRSLGLAMVKKLSEVLPRQNFAIALQAAIGGTIIAREDIRPFRKDVTAKLYGGDITRKRKLLEKQKEGKKKMKEIGRVNIPQEAFVELLKVG
jgi:GTP-binding protein LepA